jgi:phosphatidylglycerophosphatase A
MVPWKIRTLGLLLLYAVSWWAIRTLLSAQHADRDPSWIVADEFSALAGLSLLFPIETLSQAGLSFVFFRFWDVCKIFPADWLETLPVPWGILLDDVVALFYTALCLWLLA